MKGDANTMTALPPLASVLEQARLQRLSLTDVFRLTEERNRAARQFESAEIYKVWIAFNEAHPLLHLVFFNYSVTLRQTGDIAGSIHALRACLKLDPKFGQAHINLGRAYEESGVGAQAIQQWRRYTELTAESTADQVLHRLMALQHIGRVMENAGLYEDAETALWQAIELRPDKPEAGQHWSAIRQRQCKWPILTPSDHAPLRTLIESMSPLALACYADDPLFQLARAYRYSRSLVGRPAGPLPPRKPVKSKVHSGDPLRIGYVSSDLRDHAVGFALREVMELHDKSSVEIYAYYCGDPVAGDATQERMKKVIVGWRDIATLGDAEAAAVIAADDIDILVDVNGYTKHARLRIFSHRPAPVIVNFCGYPGSTGSPFHHYIIADQHVIPPENEIYYSETVKRIPCTQPIDRKRVVAETPTRAEVGLPDDAFVFACFNGMQKITEITFGHWMAILAATPGSVLWILTGGDPVDQRLRELANKAGIAPERLIFAPKAPNPAHFARIPLADLFLDTFPYGAHSTAADALTMGLPVLTCAGKSFATRFCQSIVQAAGIGELSCGSPSAYIDTAIALARDPARAKAIRDKLRDNRDASVLRDLPALTRRLEDVYWEMQEEAERGETPIPDLSNLDVYYDIGVELVQENLGFVDDETYRQRYVEKLSEWDSFATLQNDPRLWTGATAPGR
jgi:predicted O-linked N-acetylglucosamine transferase (SPINDLY family)